MSRRIGRSPNVQRYPCDLHVRISAETERAIAEYIRSNPTLQLNKSDVTDQAFTAFFQRQDYWTDIASRQTIEKLMEILLHFVRTYFCYTHGVPDKEAVVRGERFYRGFVKALNKLLKTHSYASQLYTADFEAALEEESDRSLSRERRSPDGSLG